MKPCIAVRDFLESLKSAMVISLCSTVSDAFQERTACFADFRCFQEALIRQSANPKWHCVFLYLCGYRFCKDENCEKVTKSLVVCESRMFWYLAKVSVSLTDRWCSRENKW